MGFRFFVYFTYYVHSTIKHIFCVVLSKSTVISGIWKIFFNQRVKKLMFNRHLLFRFGWVMFDVQRLHRLVVGRQIAGFCHVPFLTSQNRGRLHAVVAVHQRIFIRGVSRFSHPHQALHALFEHRTAAIKSTGHLRILYTYIYVHIGRRVERGRYLFLLDKGYKNTSVKHIPLGIWIQTRTNWM